LEHEEYDDFTFNESKSLFTFNETERTDKSQSHSFMYHSQPLLSFQGDYGTMRSAKKKKKKLNICELIKSEDDSYYATTFDLNQIIEQLLSARTSKPGTFVDLRRADIENICAYSKTRLMQQPVFIFIRYYLNMFIFVFFVYTLCILLTGFCSSC
jgi:hypothetical protein